MVDSKQVVTPLVTRKVQIFSNQSSLLTRAKARMTRSKLPVKDVEYFSSESSEGEELSLKPSHVSASKLRWADYPSSSSESLLPALVTEATSGDPDALLKAVEGLRKAVSNQVASSSVAEKALENKEDSLRTSDRGKQVTMEESLEQQKQEQLNRTILQARQGGTSQSSLVYAKPYTRRIDNLSLPDGYQPPKFQMFSGKGNPRQHVAHFVETCNNAGTYRDLMVKQFVRSLEDAAFECTKRTVSLLELANTKQKKDESVTDFIERWRNLVLNCREKISEIFSIDTCVQGMHWGLLYNLQANMPHTFEELATRAHDLEIQIASHGNFLPTDARDKKESRKDVKKEVKPSKVKETMAVITALVKISQQKPKPNPKQAPKRLEEVGRVNDPKYCKYHRIVSHPIGKCFVLKDLIVRLEKEGKIQLESEEGSATTNVAMGAIQVKFQIDDEEKIAYAYLDMPTSGGPGSLSLYDLMTVNLEDWESSSESEDEVGDGWSTFISKSKKHRNPVSSGMPLSDPHKIISIMKEEASFKTHTTIHPTKSFISFSFASNTKKSRTMPEGYFSYEEVSVNVTSFKTENKPSSKEEAEGSNSQSNDPEADGSIEKLKQLPSYLQLSKALQLSWDTRLALVQALLDPKKFQGELAKLEIKAECLGTITFTDEDLQLGI
ncbi:hypothetical protein SLEP1_g32351 [Rubroshorea leprosula]|uniref:Uncharacterized protein n=1 Tax=Rubroshorea leprosula TaxID=152421 RepID=A0AAV5KD32_9ROSI|nr:hypothetical protein SLEP1_g32351 [Rubroshorea leprosula]